MVDYVYEVHFKNRLDSVKNVYYALHAYAKIQFAIGRERESEREREREREREEDKERLRGEIKERGG